MKRNKFDEVSNVKNDSFQNSFERNPEVGSEEELVNKSEQKLLEKRIISNYNCDSNSEHSSGSQAADDHEIKSDESRDSFPSKYLKSDFLENLKPSNVIHTDHTEIVKSGATNTPVHIDASSDEVPRENCASDEKVDLEKKDVFSHTVVEDTESGISDTCAQSVESLYSSPISQISEMNCSVTREVIDSSTINEYTSFSSSAYDKENESVYFSSRDEVKKDMCLDSLPPHSADIEQSQNGISLGVDKLETLAKPIDNHEREDGFIATELMSNETINDLFDKMYDENTERKDIPSAEYETNTFENKHCHRASADFKNEDSVLYNLDLQPKSSVHVVSKSSLKRPSETEEQDRSPRKKSKKGITFNSVSVYYFPRTQGFTCIPSQGGSTLGMSWNHSHSRTFSLGEHAAEQRRAHRQYCSQQFSSGRSWNEMSSEDSDSDEIVSDSEMDFENYNFLQPIPTRERRAMLRAAGIHKIDSEEKDECRSIRLSREFCGCTCQIYCDPERCVCAQAGIKCQVDRTNFPCSCTRDGCANEHGRIEFNPVRVRTHYIHTLMRLEMEKKKEEEEQRNRLILNNLDNSSQLSYSSSSSSSSSVNVGNDNLMHFSYHNNLQSYYQQPASYNSAGQTSVAGSCFNFSYAHNNHFVLPLGAETSSYHQITSSGHMRLTNVDCSSAMQYCSELSSSQEESLSISEYADEAAKEQSSPNFIIRDLTNGLKCNNSNEPYGSESYIPLKNENFEQHLDDGSQSENLDTSAEVSEETEKEESDTENFGDIIKKTMVESVIA